MEFAKVFDTVLDARLTALFPTGLQFSSDQLVIVIVYF